MEPVRVIQPTSADSPAATIMTVNSSVPSTSTSLGVSMNLQISESATRADAAPPNPLKRATSSGIPVISTRTAIHRPMSDPITSPEPMRTHSIPSPRPICRIVVTTATSIPSAPSWFPNGAVRGCPNFLSPKINNAAERRYPSEIQSSISSTSTFLTGNHIQHSIRHCKASYDVDHG